MFDSCLCTLLSPSIFLNFSISLSVFNSEYCQVCTCLFHDLLTHTLSIDSLVLDQVFWCFISLTVSLYCNFNSFSPSLVVYTRVHQLLLILIISLSSGSRFVKVSACLIHVNVHYCLPLSSSFLVSHYQCFS